MSSKEGIRFGRDIVLGNYLKEGWYKDNYATYYIENNANEIGYKRYLEIMGEDELIENLRSIEHGKLRLGQYKADINSWNNDKHYISDDYKERDDLTIPILDHMICVKGKKEILTRYPILQKEYNLDGTKKSAIELIRNLKYENQMILKHPSISDDDKKILLKDGQEMYYELIFRELKKCEPEQINQIANEIGNEQAKKLFSNIEYYFRCEMEDGLGKSATMISAQEKTGVQGFIMPYNDGTINVEKNGKMVQMNCDDFIKIINPKLMKKIFSYDTRN